MDENLIEIPPEELERDIAMQMAVMRARKMVGRDPASPYFPKALVAQLRLSGIRIFREPHDRYGGTIRTQTEWKK